jgi:AbiJ N-terminal domain 4
MAIIDIFSKRKKRQESQGRSDVYQYDDIPTPFRIQVVHIWRATLGRWWRGVTYSSPSESPSCDAWKFIQDTIAKEKGVWKLSNSDSHPDTQCTEYLMSADTDGALDIIEVSFRVIDIFVRKLSAQQREAAFIEQDADDAIEELNHRFREHVIGYQYLEGQIVRVDSQFLHAETVKPTLELLYDCDFTGASDEFMRAFDHHRKGDNKEAIAEALKAFESTMKSICLARRWPYGSKDTAKPLMDILFKNGLVPPQMESHFAGLRSAMESGLPTLANPNRHGQGPTPVDTPPYVAAYALHLVASNIVFLVECHKAKK